MLRARATLATLAAAALVGAAAVSGTAGTAAPGGKPAAAAFRLADGSVGCNFFASGTIACRSADSRTALVLEPDGESRAADVDVRWTKRTRVLLAGESWWNGAFSCRVDHGVVCGTDGGGQIVVGRNRVGALAPPATFAAGDA